jgi:TPP-dependent indolepyruvate ferredoxin oxidoreductase alpha subunit
MSDDFKNFFFVALWKIELNDIILNRNYRFSDSFSKIILTLPDQKITQAELEKIEKNNWLLIEVEDIMKNATQKELENYLKSHFEAIERSISESSIINPEIENMETNKLKIENIDSFFNDLM